MLKSVSVRILLLLILLINSIQLVAIVPTVPPMPTLTNNCGSTSISISAPPSGVSYYWETTSTGTALTAIPTSVTTAGTYYIRAKDNTTNEWSSARSVAITVKAIPAAPSVTHATRCKAGSVTLTASCSTPGAIINWYDGSTLQASGETTFTTPSLSESKVYTVKSSLGTCFSGSYASTVTILNPTITSTTPGSVCNSGTVTLSATASAGTINWYTNSTATTGTSGASFTTPVISASTPYYVDAVENYTVNGVANTCYSPRLGVTATVNKSIAITTQPASQTVCSGTTASFSFVKTGTSTSYQWKKNGTAITGATSATYSISNVSSSNAGTYTVELSGPCNTITSANAVLTVNTSPTLNVVTQNRVGAGAVSLSASSSPTGIPIEWYSPGNALLTTGTTYSPTITGTTTYTVKAKGSLCTTTKTATAKVFNSLSSSVGTGQYVTTTTMNLQDAATPSLYVQNNSSQGQGQITQYIVTDVEGDIDIFFRTDATSDAWDVESFTQENTNWLTIGSAAEAAVNTDGTKTFKLTASYTTLSGTRRHGLIKISVGASNSFIYLGQSSALTNKYQKPVLNTGENFVYSADLKTEVSSLSQVTLASAVSEHVTYYDGLGRATEDIQIGASPSHKDIVMLHKYDELSRETNSYLPFESPGYNFGSYIDNSNDAAFGVQASFYEKIYPGEGSYAFSEKLYENSPLNRLIAVYAPGKAWDTKPVQFFEYPSTVTVYKYTFSGINSNIDAFTKATPDVVRGTYDIGALMVKETRGENWQSSDGNAGKTFEYTDKSGKVVMKETYENINEPMRTYYIYDDFDHLRCVIPPAALGDFTKTGYCYYYSYDEWGRMVEKKLPGADVVYMVYDERDRLVATQDGVMRSKSTTGDEWLFTKYDQFDRPVMTGTYSVAEATSRATVQGSANAFNTFYETRTTTGYGYTNNTFPSTTETALLSVTYYDTYEYPSQKSYNTSKAYGIPSTYNTDVIGLVTGSKTRLLEKIDGQTSNMWLLSSTYYDERTRPIQVVSDNHLGGTDYVSMTYFGITTQVIETTTQHQSVSGGAYTCVKNQYEYDHTGRLLREYSEINAHKQMLSQNNYNAIGQLKKKSLHQLSTGSFLQDVDYQYNIRGWLTSINNPASRGTDLFAMSLYYDKTNPALSGKLTCYPQYNGNISSVQWVSEDFDANGLKGTFTQRYYGYQYDKVNRLIAGNYYDNNNTNFYHESITRYDLNGNIVNLKRTSGAATTFVDNLTYTYENTNTSNRLQKVDDAYSTSTAGSFRDVQGNDYGYDANGNLTKDQNKGVTGISYNILNLPKMVITYPGTLSFAYDAAGIKHRQDKISGGITVSTDYIGQFVYKKDGANARQLEYIITSEGICRLSGTTSENYQYTLKDHLGNTRVIFNEGVGSKAQTLNTYAYYPFGAQITDLSYNAPQYKYQYNGKESVEDFDLDWYDYGMRQYDPQIARWHSIDPLADKFVSLTPYNYAINNPLRFIDPNGMEASETDIYGRQKYDSFTGLYIAPQDRKSNSESNYSKHNIEAHSTGINPHKPNFFSKSKEADALNYMWGMSWINKSLGKWNTEVLSFITPKGIVVLPSIDFLAVRDGVDGRGRDMKAGNVYSNYSTEASPSLFSVNMDFAGKQFSYSDNGSNYNFNILGSIHSHPPDPDGYLQGISAGDMQTLGPLGTVFVMDATNNMLYKGVLDDNKSGHQASLANIKYLFNGEISLYDNLGPFNTK